MVDLWNATAKTSPLFCDYARVLLLTAQRAGEVAGMRWCDLDFERAYWTIPAELVKSRRTHVVPLSRQALAIIADRPRFEGCDFVFSARGAHGFTTLNKLKRALDGKMAFGDWRLHDLRRTAATGMSRLGVSFEVVGKVLGHSQAGVTAVYQRYGHEAEKRAALQAWADHLDRIAAGVTNVVPIRGTEAVA
ncbi:MAG: site-specific integrase [Candidatus Competibacteraceae bacterium]|nr:site-specific integrase [Candidatus Competibacteraceae bacterium]